MRPTHTVLAKRYGAWWGLTVPDAPGAVSQVRRLSQADEYIREAVAFITGTAADSFDLTITAELDGLEVAVERARQQVRDAEQAQLAAAAVSREVVKALRSKGLTGADTAAVLGVSAQRVSQLSK